MHSWRREIKSVRMILSLIYFLSMTGAFQASGDSTCVPAPNALKTFQIESEISPENALSLLTRYAGMGYNLLYANPEGDSRRGGADPGVKETR